MLAGHPVRGATPVLDAMKEELQRSVETLSKQPTPLYFLSYEVTGNRRYSVRASFGNITGSSEGENAVVDVDLRVGSPELDNTHSIRGDRFANFPRLCLSADSLGEIRRRFEASSGAGPTSSTRQPWNSWPRSRPTSGSRWKRRIKPGTSRPNRRKKWLEEPLPLEFDRTPWEEKLRRYTAPFSAYGHIYSANATLSANVETRWYVNSEGSEIRTSQSYYRLMIMAYTKAEDGMELPRYESFFSFTPEGLPDDSRDPADRPGNDCRSRGPAGGSVGGPLYRTRHPLRPGQRGVLP